MTPFTTFSEVVTDNPNMSLHDAWWEFACWEKLRDFHDDPNADSKEAIEWVRTLHRLYLRLNEYHGVGKQRCRECLDEAFAAFAELEFEPQLCEAVRHWKELREES